MAQTDSKRPGYARMARWAWRNMAGVRLRVALRCLCGVARVALSLAFVWLSRSLVDAAVSPGGTSHSLMAMSAALVGLLLAELGLGLLAKSLTQTAEIDMKSSLRLRLFDRIMHSRAVDRQTSHSADMVSRLTDDAKIFCDLVVTNLPLAAVMLVQFAGAFAMFCMLSWQLALCVAAIAPLFLLAGKVHATRTRKLASDIRKAESSMQVAMQEGIYHQSTIQALEAQDFASGKVDAALGAFRSSAVARLRMSLTGQSMAQLGFSCCFLTAFIWSIWHLHSGAITFGSMTAFLQLVSRMQTPVASLSRQVPAIAHAAASVERLMAIDHLPLEKSASTPRIGPHAGVRFNKVKFRYPGADADVLSDFSADFTPGSKTVVMGPTGIGKTTLARLILGQLEPLSGTVSIYCDGAEHLASTATRSLIAFVPQGNSLLSGTIRENLLMAAPAASEQDIAEALHTAAADFVFDLPQGLDTTCGERACTLSEGQAQRIAIARALLRKCPILLLDEFNSSLDQATSHAIIDRLLSDRSDSTIIIIAHHFDTLAPFSVVRL